MVESAAKEKRRRAFLLPPCLELDSFTSGMACSTVLPWITEEYSEIVRDLACSCPGGPCETDASGRTSYGGGGAVIKITLPFSLSWLVITLRLTPRSMLPRCLLVLCRVTSRLTCPPRILACFMKFCDLDVREWGGEKRWEWSWREGEGGCIGVSGASSPNGEQWTSSKSGDRGSSDRGRPGVTPTRHACKLSNVDGKVSVPVGFSTKRDGEEH
jgi:hypothetical protein